MKILMVLTSHDQLGKPIWRFNPKNYEERAVPLPAAMIEQLQELRTRRNATSAELIFPNTKGKPNSLHIEVVKRVAHRAKLNCGQCVTKHGNRCAAGPYCQRFYLHKLGPAVRKQLVTDTRVRRMEEFLMQSEARSLISARWRKPLNLLLYLFIAAQYVVLFILLRQSNQQHALSLRAFFLPILYLCPLAFGFGFKARLRILSRNGLISEPVAYVCSDWLTGLLCIVYGILLKFRTLS